MKVLHINLSPPGKGGIERLLVDFFDSLHGHGFEIGMCILGGDSETGRRLAQRGCPIWTMRRRPRGFDWGLYPRLLRLLRSYRPAVVHIHGNPGLIYGAPAARGAGFRSVLYTCHFSRSDHSAVRHALLGGLLRLVPVRVAVSQAARTVLVERYHVPAATVRVIYNGVNLRQFEAGRATRKDPAPAHLTIGFCGVFRSEKQLPLLIEAFARLRQHGWAVRLLLVGDGPRMPDCRQAVREAGVEADIRFAGEQLDVRPFVEAMDIFVLPSSEEGMPVALLEAMALGKAVVASAVGGIPEIVEDGVSGWLVRATDVAALTDALSRLLGDAPLRARLGEAARRRVKSFFSLDQMMTQYARLYREMAGRAEPGHCPSG